MGATLLLLPNPEWLYERAKRVGVVCDWHLKAYIPYNERQDAHRAERRLREMREHLTSKLSVPVCSLGDFRAQVSLQEQLISQIEVQNNRCFHMFVYGHMVTNGYSAQETADLYKLRREIVQTYFLDMRKETLPSVPATTVAPPTPVASASPPLANRPQQAFLSPPTPILQAPRRTLPDPVLPSRTPVGRPRIVTTIPTAEARWESDGMADKPKTTWMLHLFVATAVGLFVPNTITIKKKRRS